MKRTDTRNGASLHESELGAFHDETRSLVVGRLPTASAVFLGLMAVAYTIEWVYSPDRVFLMTATYAVFVVVCGVGVLLTRAIPDHGPVLTLLVAVAIELCLAAYITVADHSSELCVLALIAFLTGVVVQFPWGAAGQAVVGIAALVFYAGSLATGARSLIPVPYELFALVAHILMTVFGARSLEGYRFSAFRKSVEAARHAEESARANAAKSEFLATVSHELRTPLNIIIGYTDLLVEKAFSQEEATDALARVRQQSRELVDLIQGLLDLNRLEVGGFPLVVEEFSVGVLFQSLRERLPTRWSAPGVALEWKPADEDFVLRSDRIKLEMILRNLVHNALKYTERGSIVVAAEPNGARIQFTVSDTGEGIAAEDLSRIFEMFAQGKDGPPREGGVGLGLFIVSRLTEALGGKVSAESEVGVGSRFTVSVPIDVSERG